MWKLKSTLEGMWTHPTYWPGKEAKAQDHISLLSDLEPPPELPLQVLSSSSSLPVLISTFAFKQ